ncbi:hypothetical protein [Cellulomonas iranensis]|uniref:hypothetical protein n=1 Tax=Cellulomonas iranensis TaxID=76862 RepID=UPI0013D280ED|nr:hypothetical protein [Cellulomonas iranensis]
MTGSGGQAPRPPESVTVGNLRALLASYPDAAQVEVLVPDGVGLRVLRVVAVGHGEPMLDDVLATALVLTAESIPTFE